MSRLKPLECVNCGAPLERDGLQCDYCGTAYAAEGARDDAVTLYADGEALAKVIKRIDMDEMSRYPHPATTAPLIRWRNTGGSGI